MPNVQISTSPRMTWLWADDGNAATALGTALDARRCVWEPGRRHDGEVPLATDVGIGVEALDALQTLADAGYTFAWHADQHPLNRQDNLYGSAVRD